MTLDCLTHADSLNAEMVGRWLVTTMGSTHTWDIRVDGVYYQRNPGDGRAQFFADGELVVLTRIERWPNVGGTSLIWFDDPGSPHLISHWRQSSLVQSIVRLPDVEGGERTL